MGMEALILPAYLAVSGGAGHSTLPVRLDFDRCLLKANPTVENGQRVVYLEASNEVRDLQGERVLLSALEASIPYFLKYGRIDLDHASVTNEIRGVGVNPYAFEIGRPLEAKVHGDSIWVKAAIFSSTDRTRPNRFTQAADVFWDSMHTNPPVVWYPSVAGDVYSEDPVLDNDGKRTNEVRGLRWHSIGLSRTPVNTAVAPAQTMPFRAFAKAFGSSDDIRGMLQALAPGRTDLAPQIPRKASGEPDVMAILTILDQAHPDQGLEEIVAIAGQHGIPPEHVIGTVLALMGNQLH